MAIAEYNESAEDDRQLECALSTLLLSKESNLDSLGLVNLIVLVEEKVEDEFGVSVALADERALSEKKSPFRSVEALVRYIEASLAEPSLAEPSA